MRLITKLSLLLLLGFIVYSCNDDDLNFDNTVRPSSDDIAAYADTILLNSQTADILGGVISKNSANTFLLGKYTDDLFGETSASILTQFNPAAINLPDNVDSTSLILNIVYDSLHANLDSLVTLDVYQLYDSLKQSETYRTDYSYSNKSRKIGSITFSAKESHTDSLITIDLDTVLCNEFFAELKSNPSTFQNKSDFISFFKGVYVTAESGNVVLSVTKMELAVQYGYQNAGGTDLLQTVAFVSSKEVKRVNQIVNNFGAAGNVPVNDSSFYLVGPAGKRPEIEIPVDRIKEKFGITVKDNLLYDKNNKKLAVSYAQMTLKLSDSTYINPPACLMMVRKDDVDNCYQGTITVNTKSRMIASRDTVNMSYTFDMQAYLPQAIKNGVVEDEMVLIPVTYSTTYDINYDLVAAKFKSKGNTSPLKLDVVLTSY